MKKISDINTGVKEGSKLPHAEDDLYNLFKNISSPQSRKAADTLFKASDEDLNNAYKNQEKN